MLATKVSEKYDDQNCTVMALSDGGVLVGTQIAIKLDCPLTLLSSADISLPREPMALAGIAPGGTFSYNHNYSDGEIDELVSEFRGFIESEKLTQIHNLNQLIGAGGTISRKTLTDHTIIIVSDGLTTGFEVDLAVQFLKPVPITKIVVCTPFAGVQAVDRIHVLANELFCLSVIADLIDVNHYYDNNEIPSHKIILEMLDQLV